MKRLYEFTVEKEEEVIEKSSSVNEAGETVTIEKKVKKPVAYKFYIKKPTRALREESELYHGVRLAEGIKAGLLTRSQLGKRFDDDGGLLSERTQKAEREAYKKLFDYQDELSKLEVDTTDKNTDEYKNKKEFLVKVIDELRNSLTNLEVQKESLFDETAETRARNKTLTWWVLNLAYNNDDTPFYGTGDIDKQLEKYDEIYESGDNFLISVSNDFLYLISYWFIGKAKESVDFDQVLADKKAGKI